MTLKYAQASLVPMHRNQPTNASLQSSPSDPVVLRVPRAPAHSSPFILCDKKMHVHIYKYARAAYSFSINNGFRQVRSKGFETATLAAEALLLQLRRWEAEIEHTIGFQEFMIERSRE